MSNIREVAEIAGVSVATVSRALTTPEKVSAESFQKVQDAIKAVGYRPNLLARNFRAAKSFNVVVLVPDITNPFFSQVIQSIEDRAQQRGYAVLLGDTRESSKREQDYVDRVETRLADGVIQLRPQSMSATRQTIPWVNACGCEGTPGPSIRVDNIEASKTIVDHLAALGHRRIGVISGRRDNPHSIDRLQGYKKGLEQAGLPFCEELVIEGDFTLWSGQRAASRLFDLKHIPTAICCMNDEMALGAIQTIKSRGLRVPDDISVTGFDNIQYAKYWDPPLTTIAQPAEEIGTVAMDLLLRIIDGEDLSNLEVLLPTQFMIRQSTAKAPRI
jgi:LacI family transcriptional regulator, repressor for deo operon, udp, cdd, tsx, nupC, and nupG